ncbi:AlbA family DNA-binding domain-containing protein [Polyangium mundeleinium]|uniref:ATP-binding protein n=1 Tax=Polyangium mundeleinium TaxID=2995306 RepID=A0ABT5F771_9BACT|nr:ATP-binding protein [Polyangium mundeleinium]MDC0749317.1 ATP-binding protein [Polyangium mundeleinium]
MTPRTLAEWSIEVIVDILTRGLFETEDFDFKEALPDSRDNKAKVRLRGACCALANASGGFLVFGVTNDRGKAPQARLVGLDRLLDFPEHFGSYPQACVPGIDWTFRNPPLEAPGGGFVHIVHIPRSWKAPHAVGDPNEGWRFLKRTNQGDQGMSMEEVRSAFLGFYEKRMRLQLLRAELEALGRIAQESMIAPEHISQNYSLTTFDTSVIESVLADTYPLTVSAPEVVTLLIQLRQHVRVANNKLRMFFTRVALPMTNAGPFIQAHNESMVGNCRVITALCSQTVAALTPILAGGQ